MEYKLSSSIINKKQKVIKARIKKNQHKNEAKGNLQNEGKWRSQEDSNITLKISRSTRLVGAGEDRAPERFTTENKLKQSVIKQDKADRFPTVLFFFQKNLKGLLEP